MSCIGMLVQLSDGVPMKHRYGDQKKFAIAIPFHCRNIKDVKKYVVDQFCEFSITKLDIYLSSSFLIQDHEPVETIEFFKGKVFHITLRNYLGMFGSGSTHSAENSVEFTFEETVTDEIDDSDYEPMAVPIDKKKKMGWKRKQFTSTSDGERNYLRRPLPPKPNIESSEVEIMDIPVPPNTTDDQGDVDDEWKGVMTRSAKRRKRLKRTAAKRALKQLNQQDINVQVGIESLDKENLEENDAPFLINEEMPESKTEKKIPENEEMNFDTPKFRKRVVLQVNPTALPKPEYLTKAKKPFGVRGNKRYQYTSEVIQMSIGEEPEGHSPKILEPYDPKYYENAPPVNNINDIDIGSIIAFQIFELVKGLPSLSNYKEARITGIHGSVLTLEYLKGGPTNGSMDESGIQIEGFIGDNFASFGSEMSYDKLKNLKKLPHPIIVDTIAIASTSSKKEDSK